MALRNHPEISAVTKKRVRALAEKMNYRGNILVSALLTQVRRRRVRSQGEVIAVLSAARDGELAPGPAEGVEAAKERARQTGLRVEVFWLGSRGEKSAHVGRVLHNRGVRGVILAPMPTDLLPLEIDWTKHAAVAIGYSFLQVALNRVGHAHFNGMMECHRRLRDAGCRRIGCVLERDDDRRSWHYWQAGARGAPHVLGIKAVPPLMLSGEAGERPRFERWARRHRIDGLVGNHPDRAWEWARAMPDAAVRYVSLDLPEGSPRAGVRQSWKGIFSTAVDLVAGELVRNEFGPPETPRVTLIDGVWAAGAK